MMLPHASVLVPVKNGGALWGQVLDAVLAQQTPWPFEVIAMDSGSADDSVAAARSRGVRVECIPAGQFAHGRTRNRLAELAQGEFLVYLTQDAKPADAHWLRHLVEGCDSAPDVAGAFGPHRAYPAARHVTQRELQAHFAGFGPASVVRLDDRERYARDEGYRQWLHFFSNNNSCLRRSVWQALPFPDVGFAEDQTWMRGAIEAGYAKAWVPEAAVYHSHDFGVWETLQRNFDEARSFERYFGYRLQPRLAAALSAGAALARRDWRWLRAAGIAPWGLAKNAGYMTLVEYARTLGQYLGTHHRSLPPRLQRLASRDDGLRRQGAS
jgi:rhamnosyltransferase